MTVFLMLCPKPASFSPPSNLREERHSTGSSSVRWLLALRSGYILCSRACILPRKLHTHTHTLLSSAHTHTHIIISHTHTHTLIIITHTHTITKNCRKFNGKQQQQHLCYHQYQHSHLHYLYHCHHYNHQCQEIIHTSESVH